MGLSMLEHTYTHADALTEFIGDDDSNASSKKRKSTPVSAQGDDDDEWGVPRGGKKAKGGTGYAGNAKEDVG